MIVPLKISQRDVTRNGISLHREQGVLKGAVQCGVACLAALRESRRLLFQRFLMSVPSLSWQKEDRFYIYKRRKKRVFRTAEMA